MSVNEGGCPSGRFYRIMPGDTFYLIARRYGFTAAELIRLNPGVDPNNLRVGQLICLPSELPPCSSGVYWTVAAGDTLSKIAVTIGTTVARLLELNPNIDPDNLMIGQNICLPG